MRLSALRNSLVVLLLCGVGTSFGADYLYTPKPIDGEPGEGVLVREISVKKGDTLSHISKRYAGRGHYYPQILLFNEIKNPHRIHPGQVFRVPVSRTVRQQETQNPEKATSGKAATTAASKARLVEKQQKPLKPGQAEQSAFSRAVASFQQGDCEAAIKQFDEFINRYPASSLLPEAALNRSECYLKLSTK